jgi:hypothetical protein
LNTESRTIRLTMSDGSAQIISDVCKIEYINVCRYGEHQFLTENPKKKSCTRDHKEQFSRKNRRPL